LRWLKAIVSLIAPIHLLKCIGLKLGFLTSTQPTYADVYMRNNITPQEAIATIAHESSHVKRYFQGKPIGTLYDEYLAFRREFLVSKKRRPTLQERQEIWENIGQWYPDSALERNPFGKQP
jgi:hypothetical protein